MWMFNKKAIEPIKKSNVYLKDCPFCKSNDIKFYCRSSDYFKYKLEIKCNGCGFEQEKYGRTDDPHTPELFKLDWDNFINCWNNRG